MGFLAYDLEEKRVFNYIGDAQNTYPVWNHVLLLALDVYEHAYFLDFQTARAKYIDAYMQVIDWDSKPVEANWSRQGKQSESTLLLSTLIGGGFGDPLPIALADYRKPCEPERFFFWAAWIFARRPRQTSRNRLVLSPSSSGLGVPVSLRDDLCQRQRGTIFLFGRGCEFLVGYRKVDPNLRECRCR